MRSISKKKVANEESSVERIGVRVRSIALGVFLTALSALWFSEIFDNVWFCIHSSVPIPCGLDPRTYLDFGAYPLVAIGLVLIVIGLVLIVYSTLTLCRHLQSVTSEASE